MYQHFGHQCLNTHSREYLGNQGEQSLEDLEDSTNITSHVEDVIRGAIGVHDIPIQLEVNGDEFVFFGIISPERRVGSLPVQPKIVVYLVLSDIEERCFIF